MQRPERATGEGQHCNGYEKGKKKNSIIVCNQNEGKRKTEHVAERTETNKQIQIHMYDEFYNMTSQTVKNARPLPVSTMPSKVQTSKTREPAFY